MFILFTAAPFERAHYFLNHEAIKKWNLPRIIHCSGKWKRKQNNSSSLTIRIWFHHIHDVLCTRYFCILSERTHQSKSLFKRDLSNDFVDFEGKFLLFLFFYSCSFLIELPANDSCYLISVRGVGSHKINAENEYCWRLYWTSAWFLMAPDNTEIVNPRDLKTIVLLHDHKRWEQKRQIWVCWKYSRAQ